MKVANAAQMREMDRQTADQFNMPSILLMENAALRVVEEIQRRYAPLYRKRISIVCGKGNNGGDGLAVARHLSTRCGADVTIWLAAHSEELKDDAAINYSMARSFGLMISPANQMDLSRSELVIDALLGTGLKEPIAGHLASIVESINKCNAPILAVDMPSGVNSETGAVDGSAVKADLTITFALPKYGLLDFPGAEYAGEVVVVDIGMPEEVKKAKAIDTYHTTAADVARWLPPRINGRDSNKGKYGHVMAFAGSGGFVGAPVMVAEAAARMGAGLVTLIIPEGIHQATMSRVSPVIMTRSLPQSEQGTFIASSVENALKLAEKAAAVALGPGLGKGKEAAGFVREFVAQCPVPLIIDADALNLLSQEPDHGAAVVQSRSAPTILTPHPGEMGRLLGKTTEEVQANRRAAVDRAAACYQCIVLLKGARTLIASPEGQLYINTTSNPGMATGGAGDVLTGLLAALLAQHLEPLQAAAAGVYLHGLAGDIASAQQGTDTGLIATDLISHLPLALARCQKGDQ
jgi:hydroxyethylthiazole kinase-like uncharacterized protein yjeF